MIFYTTVFSAQFWRRYVRGVRFKLEPPMTPQGGNERPSKSYEGIWRTVLETYIYISFSKRDQWQLKTGKIAFLWGILSFVVQSIPPIFSTAQSSKLKARTSLLPRFSEKRRSSFDLWALKQLSKMSPQVGLMYKGKFQWDILRCPLAPLAATFPLQKYRPV